MIVFGSCGDDVGDHDDGDDDYGDDDVDDDYDDDDGPPEWQLQRSTFATHA